MSADEDAPPANPNLGWSQDGGPSCAERLRGIYRTSIASGRLDASAIAEAENLAAHLRTELIHDGLPATKETVVAAASGVMNVVSLLSQAGELSLLGESLSASVGLYYAILFHGMEAAEEIGELPPWPE